MGGPSQIDPRRPTFASVLTSLSTNLSVSVRVDDGCQYHPCKVFLACARPANFDRFVRVRRWRSYYDYDDDDHDYSDHDYSDHDYIDTGGLDYNDYNDHKTKLNVGSSSNRSSYSRCAQRELH